MCLRTERLKSNSVAGICFGVMDVRCDSWPLLAKLIVQRHFGAVGVHQRLAQGLIERAERSVKVCHGRRCHHRLQGRP